MLIISEKDFDNLANCITELCEIFGNIASTKENDEAQRLRRYRKKERAKMSDLQNLICKITSDIKSAEIGISMLEGYLQGAGVLPGPLVIPVQELPAPSLSLGEEIRVLRIKHNITQKALAKELQISQSTLSQYENGTREPIPAILAKLADYFGVSVDYLLGRRGK